MSILSQKRKVYNSKSFQSSTKKKNSTKLSRNESVVRCTKTYMLKARDAVERAQESNLVIVFIYLLAYLARRLNMIINSLKI